MERHNFPSTTHTYLYIYVYIYICIDLLISLHTHTHIYRYIYIYIYKCIYIYIMHINPYISRHVFCLRGRPRGRRTEPRQAFLRRAQASGAPSSLAVVPQFGGGSEKCCGCGCGCGWRIVCRIHLFAGEGVSVVRKLSESGFEGR